MSKKNRSSERFWAHQQTTARLPIGNAREVWGPDRAWRQGARREARSQRSLPLRVGPPLSAAAAWPAGGSTAAGAVTTF